MPINPFLGWIIRRWEVQKLLQAVEYVTIIEGFLYTTWVFSIPKIGVPQNGWFIMENPIKDG